MPAPGMESPCVVCCGTDAASADASVFTMSNSRATAIEKILYWQNHQARRLNEQVKVFLDFGDVKESAWPLCQSCVSLLAQIDKVEAEYVKVLSELWRTLDSSYHPEPLDIKLDFGKNVLSGVRLTYIW